MTKNLQDSFDSIIICGNTLSQLDLVYNAWPLSGKVSVGFRSTTVRLESSYNRVQIKKKLREVY